MAGQQVLVVDDELILLMDLESELSNAGYIVHGAANALSAFEALQRHPEIELVVTDLQMPGSGDGRALAHYIRATTPALPIIVISGADVAPEEIPSDNITVLAKPIRIPALVEAIDRLVPGRAAAVA